MAIIDNINTLDEFEKFIKGKEFVVVDFWANWCGPCRLLSYVVDEYSADNPDVSIVKVNVDTGGEIASAYGVQTLPTIILFSGNKEIASNVGCVSRSVLDKFISENQ